MNEEQQQVENKKQVRQRPVSRRCGVSGILSIIVALAAVIYIPQQAQAIEWVGIVDDVYFTGSVYYTIYYNFIEGIQWGKLENAAECRSDFAALLDSFYMLNKLHKDTTNYPLNQAGMEARVFNVSNIISGPYQLSLKHCTLFMGKLQEKYVDQKNEFLDLTDLYTSFLLNLLSVSYDVRTDLEQVLVNYNAGNYGDYARTLGQILRSVTTFDSLATGSLFDQEHEEDFADEYEEEQQLALSSSEPAYNKYGINSSNYYDNSKGILYENDASLGPLMDVSQDRRPQYNQPLVEAEDEWAYTFTFVTPFDTLFGFIQGALNTLPTGDNLFKCGTEAFNGRTHVKNFLKNIGLRNLNLAVSDAASGIAVVNTTMYYCYTGGKETFTNDYFQKLFGEYSFVQNLLFNTGYMWTDIVMLLLARPTNTEEDYAYFVAFYIGDFIFRIIFKATSDGNCWYPWNNCT